MYSCSSGIGDFFFPIYKEAIFNLFMYYLKSFCHSGEKTKVILVVVQNEGKWLFTARCVSLFLFYMVEPVM